MHFASDHPRHIFEESACKSSDAVCKLCKSEVSLESLAYYCRECSSHFHKDCLTITNAEIHEHTLTFIRREIYFPCDVCGWDPNGMDMYGCLQCDFFLHRQCIYLPKVIKLTRHSHRLFHVFRISSGDNICGVCHSQVDAGYGGYCCIEKTCNYVVHLSCIIRFDVWDGKDLVEEPESEEVDSELDLAPLVEIDGKSKRHISHEHDLLRLDMDDKQEGGQVCQACILPIEYGGFLDCKQCDFALHEVCARLPRKMEHGIHIHQLTLYVETWNYDNGFFTCSVCNQHSCGFMYKCSQEECGFKMDVKCASFAEPFNHSLHKHPLYLAIYYDEFIYKCVGCAQSSRYAATCYNECWFSLEFKCVNLPKSVKYKHDTHLLTLYCDKDYSKRYQDQLEWWCEICEENIMKSKFCYTCHDCSTTLHVECILGKYPYLKSGHRIKVSGFEVEIVPNNGVTRPICHTCQHICQDKQVFNGRDDVCFCSINCIRSNK
ncbi:hypothetical protein CARUB_v10006261mg [Capsella rubella]|uniref:Phorbol-ester/DAG-type domain-containing protein n=1 Tax=Capsella rubella TaxID=81985 RepID=R0F8A9_9BRAS|nr:uncharacterized protein LOC17879400 [Capsella rubella]EOA17856.1 hypothetical protein CARUB_v10006261mg [Capsella rubella]